MVVVKRDAEAVPYDSSKISKAIVKAMKNGGVYKPEIADEIADEITLDLKDEEEVSIYTIENLVFDKLISKGQRITAKSYEGYRKIREIQREVKNTTDDSISELLEDSNDYWTSENANKNPVLNTTKRDYMAGIISTDACRRYLLPPEIVQAHDEGIIHFHK